MASPSSGATILQYLVDTRKLWPAATKTKQLEDVASRALKLLTDDERTKVLKFFFVADAKMALVSHLLKHWVVSKTCGIPWSQTTLSRDGKGKPVFFHPEDTKTQPVSFNVSHQAGLVSLVAVHGYDGPGSADVGTDIVCTSERRERDHKMIHERGWAEFVDMHADVFGRSEAAYLRTGDLLSNSSDVEPDLDDESEILDAKLRAFYALWCYREAYVKMTGEALLAEWLNDLEFKNFRAPSRGSPAPMLFKQVGQPAEEVIKGCEMVFRGTAVNDVNVCLRSLGSSYMTCSAVRTPQKREVGMNWELGPYEFLSLEQILNDAEAAGGR